ncbi:MAG TPA: flagellar basal body rod protein FlgB [Holophaga sp.]|jgi:flagellar basal-body rod protein FlgB|nr:flagellar basal body rod protein FlgB [Holophaga sp.]
MFDLLSSDRMIQTMDRSLSLSTRRMELIASNLSNIDTPGYRTKDFDFSSALKSELDQLNHAPTPLARTDPKHFASANSGSQPSITNPNAPSYERNDGNDVSLDRESNQLARTQFNYQLASNFAQSKLRQIYLVVKG